jgi:hypothetical protein
VCGWRTESHLPASIVISNADAGWTYTRLLANHPRKRWTDAKVDRAKYSMSLFVWYFGTDRRYEDVGSPHRDDGPALWRTSA